MRYPGTSRRQTIVGIITLVVLAAAIAIGVVLDNANRGGMAMFRDNLIAYDEEAVSSGGTKGYDSYAFSLSDTSITAYSAGQTAAEVDQKIIKTGYLTITVDGVIEKVQAISSAATTTGGFVQSSSVSEDGEGDMIGYVVIRIPADKFESTMQSVKDLAVHIESESSEGQDVTEHYTDLEARLNAAKAQEAQYLLILEDTSTVGEVLAVQEHLAMVRSDIESLEGQIQYLANQTKYSTISINASEETKVSIPSAKFDLIRDAKEAAKFTVALGQKAITALIWIVIVGGAIAIPLAIIGGAGRLITKRTRKSK